MSHNHSDKESELFSDLNITRSFKTYSRSKNLISPSKEGTNKRQKINVIEVDVLQQKKFLQNIQRNILNKETSIMLSKIPSQSLKVNGYGTQMKKNSTVAKSNGTLEFGKDWDEMEFLGTKSNPSIKPEIVISPITVPKQICNGQYARTRRNMVKKISYASDPGKSKSIDEKNCASQSNNGSEVFSISSIISKSPTKVMTFSKKGFVDKTNSSPSEPKTLSLMDMVRKYSSNPNSISSSVSNPKGKEHTEKEVCSTEKKLQLHVSEVLTPSPSKKSTKPQKLLSTRISPNSKLKVNSPVRNSSPLKWEKEKASPQRKNGIKTPKRQSKNIQNKMKRKYTKKSKEPEISDLHAQSIKNKRGRKPNKGPLKTSPNVVDKASKKMKTIKSLSVISNSKENPLSNNVELFPPKSVCEVQVSPAGTVKNSAEVLTQSNSVVSLIPSVLPQSSNLNSVVSSTALLPAVSLSNTFTNAYVTPDNNLVYSVNPYVPAFQPTLPNVQSTIFVIPVPCASCNNVPNQQNSNNSQTAPPFYQLNCTGQNVESCVRNIVKSYYPQSQLNFGNSNNNSFQINPSPMNSFSTVNFVNENVTMHQNISNAPLFDVLASSLQNDSELCKDNSVQSDPESDIGGLVTIDRSVSLLGHFYELMEKQSKLSLKQCKEQAKEIFDTLFLKDLSVEAFCMCPDVPEFFSNFCFMDSKRKQTNYKFDQDFKNSSLVDVLKKYISEHIKTILDSLSPDPLLKIDQVLKVGNSNLSLAEKLLMKKILGAKKGISLRDLIGALFFVGLISIFKEYKENRQNREDF